MTIARVWPMAVIAFWSGFLSPVCAQSTSSPHGRAISDYSPRRSPGLREEELRLQRWIDAAVSEGRLTGGQTDHAKRVIGNVRSQDARSRANNGGRLTAGERRQLSSRLRGLSIFLHRASQMSGPPGTPGKIGNDPEARATSDGPPSPGLSQVCRPGVFYIRGSYCSERQRARPSPSH